MTNLAVDAEDAPGAADRGEDDTENETVGKFANIEVLGDGTKILIKAILRLIINRLTVE